MAPTAHEFGSFAQLSALAADPRNARRSDIYLAIVSLYQHQAFRLAEHERALMREILQRLADDVEMAIRITLAEKLADDDGVPPDLILLLADDRIEVARPLILRSRQLSDADLLTLLEHAGEAHQTACAERPAIGEAVCDILAASSFEPVLVALVRNATARISSATFEKLVERSRQISALQAPLAYRADLPASLATRMCEWVSEALQSHIRLSYPSAEPLAERGLADAVQALHLIPEPASAQPASSAVKLVDKLSAAGQLRAAFLLRVLQQGQLDLFDVAFARLLELELDEIRQAVYEGGPRPVALACRAVGIDRSVFPTVYSLTRQSRGERPALSMQDKCDVETIFETFTKAEARVRVRRFVVQKA